MSFIAVAIIGSAALGASSAKKAAKAQKNASASNTALAERQMEEEKRRYDADREDKWTLFNAQMAGDEELDQRNRADKERAYQRGRTDNLGAMTRGESAGNQLAYRMGLGGTGTGKAGGLNDRYKDFSFEAEPGYQFRMGEGQANVNNKMAASGSLLSGAAMKALTRFNQDYASNEYGNSYNRYANDRANFSAENTNEYNRLMGVQGAGQNAVNSVAGLAGTVIGQASNAPTSLMNSLSGLSAQQGQSSNNYYNNLMSNNNASANASAAYNNALGNALGGGLGSLAGAWNSYQKNNKQTAYPTQNFGGYDYLDF
jgi:hypothetical protein